MKRTILSIAIAAMLAACGQQKSADVQGTAAAQNASDTSGLAQYKQWKQQQQELVDAPLITENTQSFNTSSVQDEVQQAEPKQVIIYRTAPSKPVAKVTKPAKRNASVTPRVESGSGSTSTSSGGESAGAGIGEGTSVSDAPVATTETPAEKKKGWSKAAKGTVIGAGSGAVLGAILTKDKAKGAIIGGILGAGAGYGLGRVQDKKDGRY